LETDLRKRLIDELRSLNDRDLARREQELSVWLFRARFSRSLGNETVPSSSLQLWKKERAQILTIQKQRQLHIDGLMSRANSLKGQHNADVRALQQRGELARTVSQTLPSAEPVVAAKLLGSQYPLILGHSYTIVLQRTPQAVFVIQQSLFGDHLSKRIASRSARRPSPGNIDLDVSFRSDTVNVDSDTTRHLMKRRSSLEVSITPREVGQSLLEIIITISVSKQLLQVLQVPMEVVLESMRPAY
jgi:ribosomal protein L29